MSNYESTAVARFFNKVRFPSVSDCILWTARKRSGYGQFYYKGRLFNAHRVSYMWFRGDIKPGLEVHHKCYNRDCVNPFHLEAITGKQNRLDAGCQSVGARNFRKLECNRGHKLDGENLRIRKNGARVCRLCEKEAGRIKRTKKAKASRQTDKTTGEERQGLI